MTSFSGIQSLEPFSTSHRAGGGGEIVNEATVTVADRKFHVRLEDVSLVFSLKVLGKWIHFWMFKCWGRNQRPYYLKGPDELGLSQTLFVGSKSI